MDSRWSISARVWESCSGYGLEGPFLLVVLIKKFLGVFPGCQGWDPGEW